MKQVMRWPAWQAGPADTARHLRSACTGAARGAEAQSSRDTWPQRQEAGRLDLAGRQCPQRHKHVSSGAGGQVPAHSVARDGPRALLRVSGPDVRSGSGVQASGGPRTCRALGDSVPSFRQQLQPPCPLAPGCPVFKASHSIDLTAPLTVTLRPPPGPAQATRSPPHLKSLNLITSAKSLLPCEGTSSEIDILGGPLFCRPTGSWAVVSLGPRTEPRPGGEAPARPR